jgi:hypothetical protein
MARKSLRPLCLGIASSRSRATARQWHWRASWWPRVLAMVRGKRALLTRSGQFFGASLHRLGRLTIVDNDYDELRVGRLTPGPVGAAQDGLEAAGPGSPS